MSTKEFCRKCGVVLTEEKMIKHTTWRLCKNYYRSYQREWYSKNKQKALERWKRYRENNLDKIREKSKREWMKIKSSPSLLEKHREKVRKQRWELKLEVLKHYSPELKCARCGFSDVRALSIDHVNGGGSNHIKEIGGASKFYRWLKKNNYPPGFQVLCMNCQFIRRYEK
jgi:ribosomal protein L36